MIAKNVLCPKEKIFNTTKEAYIVAKERQFWPHLNLGALDNI